MTKIFCDGASKGNPGKGGWGVWIQDTQVGVYGGAADVTNNQMELTAAIEALQYCQEQGIDTPTLITDSQYVKNGLETWLAGWKKKGWKTTTGPVKNEALWRKLDALNQAVRPKLMWVRGHQTDSSSELVIGNNKADELANMGCVNPQRTVLTTY